MPLPAGTYHLKISHVSYINKEVTVEIKASDTVVNILLEPKNFSLKEVQVRPNIARKNIINYGNAYKRSRSIYKFPMDTRIGMVFKPDLHRNVRYLNSIKFRLQNTSGLGTEHDNLEIKLYNMVGHTIANEPVNTKPIYVKLEKIKIFNEIKIYETIQIPEDGLFVVFELPNIYNDYRDLFMNFIMSIDNEVCNLYIGNVTNSNWNAETFPKHAQCHGDPFNGKYDQLNIGITYY